MRTSSDTLNQNINHTEIYISPGLGESREYREKTFTALNSTKRVSKLTPYEILSFEENTNKALIYIDRFLVDENIYLDDIHKNHILKQLEYIIDKIGEGEISEKLIRNFIKTNLLYKNIDLKQILNGVIDLEPIDIFLNLTGDGSLYDYLKNKDLKVLYSFCNYYKAGIINDRYEFIFFDYNLIDDHEKLSCLDKMYDLYDSYGIALHSMYSFLSYDNLVPIDRFRFLEIFRDLDVDLNIFMDLYIKISELTILTHVRKPSLDIDIGIIIGDLKRDFIADIIDRSSISKLEIEHQITDMISKINSEIDIINSDYTSSEIKYPTISNKKQDFELENILKLETSSRVEALNNWKQDKKETLNIMAKMPKNIINFFSRYDFLDLNDDDFLGLIEDFKQRYCGDLDDYYISWVVRGIIGYKKANQVVLEYLYSPKYKNNHRKLVGDIFGVNESSLVGNIDIEVGNMEMIIVVSSQEDFNLLISYGKEKNTKKYNKTNGFVANKTNIKELSRVVVVVKNLKTTPSILVEKVKYHESRHVLNKLLFPEYNSHMGFRDPLVSAKDEIIAFLSEGDHPYQAQSTIRNNYDYFDNIEDKDSDRYHRLDEIYKEDLDRSFEIVKKLQAQKVHNYINLLSITPIREWHLLEKLYINPNQRLGFIDKIKDSILKIIF